jgi:hypothetical protein
VLIGFLMLGLAGVHLGEGSRGIGLVTTLLKLLDEAQSQIEMHPGHPGSYRCISIEKWTVWICAA